MPVTYYAGQKLRASDLQNIIDDHLRVARTTDLPRISTATLANDDQLVLPLQANYTYIVRVVAYFLSAAAADIQVALAVPTLATFPFGGLRMVDSSAGLVGDVDPGAYSLATSGSSNLTAGGTGLASTAVYEATVVVGNVAGNMTLMWAQKVITASNTTLYAGSNMTAERIRNS